MVLFAEGDDALGDAEFPRVETVVDPWGKRHDFTIDVHTTESGYFVRAAEKAQDGGRYEFAAYASGSPYLALGRLRQTIREGLATRYLVTEEGRRRLGHDKAVGRIGFDCVIIDGQEISFDEFSELLQSHEGWQFKLTIADPYEAM